MTNNGEDKEALGGGEPLEAEELPEEPIFLRDAPPTKGKMDMIKWGLMHGKTEDELVDVGFNRKTVSMAAYALEQDGYRKRPSKRMDAGRAVTTRDSGSKPVAQYGTKALTGPTKGYPPEFLIDQIVLPFTGNGADSFEKGMKFGASMLVLGVRVAQELSNMGLQQARPIMDMASAMRAGEAEAAKGAAAEAAYLAAEHVKGEMLPFLSSLGKVPPSGDPMKSMMVKMMEPALQRLMNMAIPGMAGQGGGIPSEWTRKTREE